MGCNKVRQSCGTKNFAACIEYQGALGESSLIEDECYNLEEVVEDTYNILDSIKNDLDLESLDSCETLPTEKTPKTLIQYLIDKICALQEQIEVLQELTETHTSQISDLQTQTCD